MKWAAALAAVCLLSLVTPGWADNSISASATSCGGQITVSGTINFDTGNALSTSINIDVFKEGCLDSSWPIMTPLGSSPLSFTGNSGLTTYKSGTYTVIATITITPSGGCPADYSFKAMVTIP